MSTFERIVIAGCNGRFGRVFADKLAASAAHVTGVDVDRTLAAGAPCHDYVESAIDRPERAVLERVAQADCVLLCVPESAVLGALEPLLDAARTDACLADIASVKSRIAARVGELGGTAGYLGLHPMFAPAADFSGLNLAVVRIRENAATARLERIANGWRARTTVLTAEEHDRLTACVQVMPHAALLALGAALADSGFEPATTGQVATPVHAAMSSLLARVLHGRNETYWSIQTDNPFAAEARAGLMAALREIDAMSSRGDDAEFGQLVERISSHLGDAFDALAARSDRVVAGATDADDD